MLLSVFSALGPISKPTPPTAALTEFFHADTVASDHHFLGINTKSSILAKICLFVCSYKF